MKDVMDKVRSSLRTAGAELEVHQNELKANLEAISRVGSMAANAPAPSVEFRLCLVEDIVGRVAAMANIMAASSALMVSMVDLIDDRLTAIDGEPLHKSDGDFELNIDFGNEDGAE